MSVVLATIGAIASLAATVVKTLTVTGLAIEGLRALGGALVGFCRAVGLMQKETKVDDLGDKAIQSNLNPDDYDCYNDYVKAVREYAADVDAKVFVVCAQIEQEISELDDDEKKEFLEDLGLEESGLEKLISASYSLLGLISFLTSGEDETRAWTIKEGTKAPQAAGKIHTDFERGFICAEVVSFEDLKEYGTMQACKEKGLVRQEGKEYVVKDGDIIVFRFNV